jgi:hypothetical protein
VAGARRRGFGYVRKLPSGRWQASCLGPDRVRRTAPHTVDAKADAEGWLGRRREEVVSGAWQPPVKVERVAALTFEAYSTQWLRERALKPRTREGYEHLLGRYLLPVLGGMPIDAITPSVVRTWWSRLPADKPTVRARSYALLKAVMNTAVADEVVDSNPCRIRGAANTPRAREIRPATIEELEVIVEAMPDRLRALVLLCAWCALRSGAVLELRRRDVDIAGGTVRIVRALSWVGGEPIVGTPKSAAGTRVVSIPPHVVAAIAHHLDTMTAPVPPLSSFRGATACRTCSRRRCTGTGGSPARPPAGPTCACTTSATPGPRWRHGQGQRSRSVRSDSATAASTPPSGTSTPREAETTRSRPPCPFSSRSSAGRRSSAQCSGWGLSHCPRRWRTS